MLLSSPSLSLTVCLSPSSSPLISFFAPAKFWLVSPLSQRIHRGSPGSNTRANLREAPRRGKNGCKLDNSQSISCLIYSQIWNKYNISHPFTFATLFWFLTKHTNLLLSDAPLAYPCPLRLPWELHCLRYLDRESLCSVRAFSWWCLSDSLVGAKAQYSPPRAAAAAALRRHKSSGNPRGGT